MSLIIPTNFQHILRVMNTNVDGKRNVMFALTAIKGIGRRYANLVLKKVNIPQLITVDLSDCWCVKIYYDNWFYAATVYWLGSV